MVFFFIILPLFFSCAGVSPFTLSRENPVETGSIEEFVPLWQPLGSGSPLDYLAGKIQEPRLEFRALRAKLKDPRLRIVAGGGEGIPGRPSRPGTVTSTYVRTFAEKRHCAGAINANPFDPSSAHEGESRTVVGIAVSDGVVLAPPRHGFDALVFYKDGRAVITGQSEIDDLSLVENAVGGFHIVLRQGRLPDAARSSARHPRSAAGLSADGGILYLLCVDGRRPGSAGATEAELGLLLQQLGAFEGLNFDGGGSSALALRGSDGKVRNANTPIHNGIPGGERAVAICLGLAF